MRKKEDRKIVLGNFPSSPIGSTAYATVQRCIGMGKQHYVALSSSDSFQIGLALDHVFGCKVHHVR
jgi:hypothetical protein